jgi:predicted branched-subunit amino acid permease
MQYGRTEVSPRQAFLQGVRELLPPAPGIFAWGLVTGVAMVKSGLGPTPALLLTFAAYAGSAQLAAMPLLATMTPAWIVFLTALVVNCRFIVYAAVTRSSFAHLDAGRRALLGYMVGDVIFAKYATLLRREPAYPQKVAFYTGGALMNWVTWMVSSTIGILAADAIPAHWGLELAGTLALVALVVPLCREFPALAGVAVSGSVAVLARGLPLRLGLLLGVIAGMAAALLVQAQLRRGRAPAEPFS